MLKPKHILVDLDGTLTFGEDDESKWNLYKVGAPIEAMVYRVKTVLATGVKVKIFTARVGGLYSDNYNMKLQAQHIQRVVEDWTVAVFGHQLEVVAHKDMDTLEIWDDIAKQVVRNKGAFVAWNTP